MFMFDLTCQPSLGIRVCQAERTSNGLDGTYGKKGCDRKNGVRSKGVRKRNAALEAPLAVADRTTDRSAGGLVAGDERKASKAMFGGAIMK